MFETKFASILLQGIPPNHWNLLSNALSRFSGAQIDKPISFEENGFTLQEIPSDYLAGRAREQFLTICYPHDMPNRDQEILIDQTYYWPDASTFIAYNRAKDPVGCVQFLTKNRDSKLPVEYSQVTDAAPNNPGLHARIPAGRSAEIYRCRRSPDLNGSDSVLVVSMLFKAIWAIIVRTGTQVAYVTYDASNRELRNLYLRKLFFQDPGITVQFDGCDKKWSLLYKDCALHEQKFATLSRAHFYMMTWFRRDLREKNLEIPRRTIAQTERLLEENDTVVFAEMVKAGNK
jgi:hypothetical protein